MFTPIDYVHADGRIEKLVYHDDPKVNRAIKYYRMLQRTDAATWLLNHALDEIEQLKSESTSTLVEHNW